MVAPNWTPAHLLKAIWQGIGGLRRAGELQKSRMQVYARMLCAMVHIDCLGQPLHLRQSTHYPEPEYGV